MDAGPPGEVVRLETSCNTTWCSTAIRELEGLGWLVPGRLSRRPLSLPFGYLVFVDNEPRCISALETRVDRLGGDYKVSYIERDVSQAIPDIMAAMPSYSKEKGLLSFCFVDPFSAELDFEVFRRLAAGTRWIFSSSHAWARTSPLDSLPPTQYLQAPSRAVLLEKDPKRCRRPIESAPGLHARQRRPHTRPPVRGDLQAGHFTRQHRHRLPRDRDPFGRGVVQAPGLRPPHPLQHAVGQNHARHLVPEELRVA